MTLGQIREQSVYATLSEGQLYTAPRLSDDETLRLAVEFMNDHDLIELIEDEFAPLLVVRRADFAMNFERLSTLSDSVFQKYKLAGDQRDNWLNAALEKIDQQISASGSGLDKIVESTSPVQSRETDEQWEPLPIERTSSDFREAIESSEKAIETIESNNGYASSDPEERNGIVSTVKGTLIAIKAGAVSRGSVIEGLLKPLRHIANKFSDSVMGEIAKIAVAAIVKWLF